MIRAKRAVFDEDEVRRRRDPGQVVEKLLLALGVGAVSSAGRTALARDGRTGGGGAEQASDDDEPTISEKGQRLGRATQLAQAQPLSVQSDRVQALEVGRSQAVAQLAEALLPGKVVA